MIAMNHRLVNTVINRCTMPADGDILVPIRTVSVIGTTDIHSADPDEIPVTQAEVDQMLDDGERLVPGFREARALRVWAGVRPLFQDAKAGEVDDTRDVSRTHAVVDHRERDGIDGLLTMSGGKLTTLRLMAQDLVDAMCAQLGEERPCRTAEERPPGNEDGEPYQLGSRLRRREETLQDEQLICECELIGRGRLEEAMRAARHDQPRRHPPHACGSAWARARAGSASTARPASCTASTGSTAPEAAASLRGFLQERWKGVWPILYGDQLRQARLDDWIFQGLLDVEHLPQQEASAGMSHHDVVVVGTGLAGLTAAVRLAESGARVLVRGQGRRRDAPEPRHDRRARLRARARGAPARGARPRCVEAQPGHPYGLVGADGVARGDRVVQGARRERLAGAVRVHRRRSRRTCCCRRRSACRGRRRSCRRRWPAATCARGGPVCVVGFRALKDFHPALLADNLGAPGAGVEARGRPSSTSRPSGAPTSTRSGFARGFDDPAFRGEVIAQVARAAARRRARRVPRRARHRRPARRLVRARARARAAGVRGAHAAAVRPRHAGVRDPARGAAARRRQRRAQQRGRRGRAGRRPRHRAAHARRPARGAPRRGLGRAGHGRLRLGRPGAGLALDRARDGARAPGRRRARPGRGALPPRLLRRPSDGTGRRRGGPRAAPGRRGGRAGPRRTSSWPARRWPEPSRGARSPATGSASPPGTAPPSSCSPRRPPRRAPSPRRGADRRGAARRPRRARRAADARVARPLRQVHDLRDVLPGLQRHAAVPAARSTPGRRRSASASRTSRPPTRP